MCLHLRASSRRSTTTSSSSLKQNMGKTHGGHSQDDVTEDAEYRDTLDRLRQEAEIARRFFETSAAWAGVVRVS